MSVFKLVGGGTKLVPVKAHFTEAAVSLASQIPGAQVTDEGVVTGANHALRAVLDLDGQEHKGLHIGAVVPCTSNLPAFQREGVNFLTRNLEVGCLLNDDVGLGKTVQTIAAVAGRSECKVVMCPAFLRPQWKGEIEKWVPKLFLNWTPTVHIVWPPSDKRSKLPPPANPDWVLCYYLDIDRAMEVVGRRPYILITDEVHNLRGYKSSRLESVDTAATFASGRISLTASAMYNDAAKVFSALNVTQPGAWGTFWNYAMRYASAIEGTYGLVTGKLSNVTEFRRRFALMSLRRVKGDVYDQLPYEAVFQTVWLDMPGAASMRLSAAMSGKKGFDSNFNQTADFKVGPVVERVKNDMAEGTPGITFTYLREQAQKICAALPDSMLVLGGDNTGTRLKRIADYVKMCERRKIAPQVVGTLDALSEGANLQWAKVINMAALSNAPDQMKQAIGRAARMGQTGTVQVRIFAVRYTYDERLVDILKHKLNEQFKMDGRKEQEKLDLTTALSERNQVSALRAMYERALNEENKALELEHT